MMTQLFSKAASDETETTDKRWFRIVFFAIALLFNLCLVAQLLTVGLAVFSNGTWWQVHVWLVRGYAGLALLLLIGALLIPFPNRVRALANGVVVLLALQFITAHVHQPVQLGAVHPLLGFALFTTSTALVHRTLPRPST